MSRRSRRNRGGEEEAAYLLDNGWGSQFTRMYIVGVRGSKGVRGYAMMLGKSKEGGGGVHYNARQMGLSGGVREWQDCLPCFFIACVCLGVYRLCVSIGVHCLCACVY
jgi:hypothetical protein